MRVDLSINIPTIISILTCVVGISAFGLGIYRDLDNRQLRTDIAVVDIRTRVDKIEANQSTQIQNLRTEMRGDITEIKEMLNRLIFSGASPHTPRRQELDKEWSK